jgi:hypothetical protein
MRFDRNSLERRRQDTARRTREWRQRKRDHKKDQLEYVRAPHKKSTLNKLISEIESTDDLNKLGWRKALERHIADIVEKAVKNKT